MFQSDMISELQSMAPAAIIHHSEYAALNLRLLTDLACWSLSENDVAEMFPHLSKARQMRARHQINRDQVRITMLVLSLDAHGGAPEVFSIRRLARVLDRPKEESMQRTLRNWLLPLLGEAGWIEGFDGDGLGAIKTHEVRISLKGMNAVQRYFQRIAAQERTA
jgi:hypothetical protein